MAGTNILLSLGINIHRLHKHSKNSWTTPLLYLLGMIVVLGMPLAFI